MRVIAQAFTPAMLTSSTVPEPDTGETAWSNASVSYVVGNVRIRTTTHRQYRCKVDHVSAASPLPEDDPTRWEDIGPTNRFAMFDAVRNTATLETSPLTVVITPGKRVGSIALLGLVAQTAAVSVTSVSGGGTVYSNTVNLQTRDTGSWTDYFYGEFRYRRALALFDLPLYTDAVITVTLSHASATVRCGMLYIGTGEYIGSMEPGAVADAVNFSTVERDEDGNATMTQRRNIPVTRQRLFLDKALVPKVYRIREETNGAPACWAGQDDDSDYFEPFLINGFPRRFVIDGAHPGQALIDLELEEV
jgi:hypothetical protein